MTEIIGDSSLVETHPVAARIAQKLNALGISPISLTASDGFLAPDIFVQAIGPLANDHSWLGGNPADWLEQLESKWLNTLELTRRTASQMRERGRGQILHLVWRYENELQPLQTATTRGLARLNEVLRIDLFATRVRVSFIEATLRNPPRNAELDDLANAAVWILQRPAHVNIQQLFLKPRHATAFP